MNNAKHHPEQEAIHKHSQQAAAAGAKKVPGMLYQQRAKPDDQASTPPTGDAGGGVSEATLKDASGTETGGGIDTDIHAEENTETTIEKRKPLHQGTSAYTGGGSDNGSNL